MASADDTGAARPVALVTGASRGIGKAAAIALAQAGFDVAITARTVHEGDGRDDSDRGEGRVVPGSLDATAADVERAGVTALPIVADLLDRASLAPAVAAAAERFGRLDVLVNNAVHTGPGSMVPFLELTIDQVENKLEANVVSQIVLIKAALPLMLAAGTGAIINVTSHVATNDPPAPVGRGGWGLGYAMSKGAFHRIAGILAVELGDRGIRAYNLDPGYVLTERQIANGEALGLKDNYRGAPPSVPASVIAWLASSDAAAAMNGQTVIAQKFALEHSLHPDWRPSRAG
jgi:NAD(P)-dependent dehydrogenase (short-subunit alcohol dehydrogenase family)